MVGIVISYIVFRESYEGLWVISRKQTNVRKEYVKVVGELSG